jgi:hypothetical protein
VKRFLGLALLVSLSCFCASCIEGGAKGNDDDVGDDQSRTSIYEPLTANDCSEGVASTGLSGYNSDSDKIFRVFDNDTSTFFSSRLGQTSGSVSLEIPTPSVCDEIGFFIPEDNVYIDAFLYTGVTLYGSNDHFSTNTLLGSWSGMRSLWVKGSWNYLSFANSSAFSSYRLEFSAVNHDNIAFFDIGLYHRG